MCGLIKRESLADVDVGYAFLPQYWSQGYASEATAAVMDYGRRTLGLKRIVAIVAPENYRSIKLLEKLGLQFEQMIRLSGDSEAIMLFASGA
jgi:RimJ/RimL family protein N-acetyltransferase